MSDTPETDKYCGEDLWIGEPALVSSDFARKLERERNNLKQEVEHLKTMSVCELGAHNDSVRDYMEHWEGRALTAERDTPEGNICKVSANLGWASDTLAMVDKTMLKLSAEIKTILRERDNFQDQRDFAMGEIERLRKERDDAREALQHITKCDMRRSKFIARTALEKH